MTYRLYFDNQKTDECWAFNEDLLRFANISLEQAKREAIEAEAKNMGVPKRLFKLVAEHN